MTALVVLAAILGVLTWVIFFRRSPDKSRMGIWKVRIVQRTPGLRRKICQKCAGSGEIDIASRLPIEKYEVNANAITCPGPCAGMGWYYVKESSE